MTLRPDGSPEVVTETAPLNPFCGVKETCSVEDVPGAIPGAGGATEMVNDGGGGGGGGGWLDDPPPQALRAKESENTEPSCIPVSRRHLWPCRFTSILRDGLDSRRSRTEESTVRN